MGVKVLIASLTPVFVTVVFSMAAQAAIPRGEQGSSESACFNLWWKDDTHPTCTQKKFCGAYLYEGLQAYDTKEACLTSKGLMHQDFIVNPEPQPWYVKLIERLRSFFARFFPVQLKNTPSGNDSSTPPETGQFCGGFAGKSCPAGYRCQLDGNYPDAGGKCVR